MSISVVHLSVFFSRIRTLISPSCFTVVTLAVTPSSPHRISPPCPPRPTFISPHGQGQAIRNVPSHLFSPPPPLLLPPPAAPDTIEIRDGRGADIGPVPLHMATVADRTSSSTEFTRATSHAAGLDDASARPVQRTPREPTPRSSCDDVKHANLMLQTLDHSQWSDVTSQPLGSSTRRDINRLWGVNA